MDVIINGAGGHMGQIMTETASAAPDCRVVARVDPAFETEADGTYKALERYTGPADVVIDFSSHTATEPLLAYCVSRGLPVVIAPTGQTEAELEMIHKAAERVPILLSANLSLGVALLGDLAERAAALFGGAEVEIVERHHNRKLDVPSGTALTLAKRVQAGKSKAGEESHLLVGRHEDGKRAPGEIGIHSLRYGDEAGTHEVILSTGKETITLTHQAGNRELFAQGALRAAAFLVKRRTPGLYGMKDMLG